MTQTGFPAAGQGNLVQAIAPNLPTAFIGRSAELEDILALLSAPSCRLLTLLGPGGIGKTRLAYETGHRLADRFADGVYWVDLQPGQTADFLIHATAGALSLSGQEDPYRQLLRFLRDKSLLIILDNFEQLLDAAALLSEMLSQGPGIKILVTSRAALHLQEEWLYPVAGLPYPPTDLEAPAWEALEGYEAVQLLVERVRRVRPHLSPHDEQAGLLRICQLVEGMPLALELAASWARSLDCATIAAEIERNLAFLTSVLRNVPDRHRSIQAVLTHSWSLLADDERAVFERMAVFRGGFGHRAAEAVAGATVGVLAALVDQSLLQRQPSGRYHIHELLRQYAEQRLAQSPQAASEARHRHAAYYLAFLQRRTDAILGPGQREAAEEIGAEIDNIRAAWHWAVQHGQVEAIDGAVEPISMFCHINGQYREAAHLFEEALRSLDTADTAHQPVCARLLPEMGWMAVRLGQFDKADHLFRTCHDIYRSLHLDPLPGLGTDPLAGFSVLAAIQGDSARAEALADQARHRAEAQNHIHNLQMAHYQLASIAYTQGDYAKAQRHAQAAYTACEQTGDRWFMAYCLNELGRAARALGDYRAAARHFEASYDLRHAFSDPEGMALALNHLGDIALRRQQWADAQDYFTRSASLYRRTGDQGGLAAAYHGLGRTAAAQGDHAATQDHLRRALAIAADIQFSPLLLAILATTGHILMQTGHVDAGWALLGLVQDHPAADQETKSQVQQTMHQARASVPPALLAAMQPPQTIEDAVSLAEITLSAAPEWVQTSISLPSTADLVEPLSERELEVLHLMAQGLTNGEIAERISVVVGTVKSHNNNIFGKLGVKNRGQAVVRARELGLI